MFACATLEQNEMSKVPGALFFAPAANTKSSVLHGSCRNTSKCRQPEEWAVISYQEQYHSLALLFLVKHSKLELPSNENAATKVGRPSRTQTNEENEQNSSSGCTRPLWYSCLLNCERFAYRTDKISVYF